MKLQVLDLFSGIGGISLGLERTGGFETAAFCEIEPFQRAVLQKHWPFVPCFTDICEVNKAYLRLLGINNIDVIAGGFPCQDISVAGKGVGIDGERSGLWREMYRLICELRPSWVLAENVPALRTRGADRVLSDLEAAGYHCEPIVVGAWAVGAPHKRDRAWIVAQSNQKRRSSVHAAERTESDPTGASSHDVDNTYCGRLGKTAGGRRKDYFHGETNNVCTKAEKSGSLAHRNEDGQHRIGGPERECQESGFENSSGDPPDGCREAMAHTEQVRRPAGRRESGNESGEGFGRGESSRSGSVLADAESARLERQRADAGEPEQSEPRNHRFPARPGEPQHDWEEPRVKWPVGAPADGISERLVRFANRNTIAASGNSVVPQVVGVIGRAIMSIDGCRLSEVR